MARCRVDTSIERKEIRGFAFPLGVYPIEEMTPKEGYALWFEPADESDGGTGGGGRRSDDPDDDDEDSGGGLEDGDDGGSGPEWEEWPDRYVFDIAITATRVEALTRALLAALPGRVYPILDFLGHDAFREVDPYVSYELLGQERLIDALRRYRGFFFEDGLVGFGAMSEEPFVYVFVDEHKLITVRVETSLKEKIESILTAFDLEEIPEIAGPDSVTHEHRGVLDAPDDRPDLRNAEEIVEELIDEWGLSLNIDPRTNLDADGRDLGITGWRCVVRLDPVLDLADEEIDPESATAGADDPEPGSATAQTAPAPAKVTPTDPPPRRYAEILLTAGNLATADELAVQAAQDLLPADDQDSMEAVILAADRLTTEDFRATLATPPSPSPPEGGPAEGRKRMSIPLLPDMTIEKVWRKRLLQ